MKNMGEVTKMFAEANILGTKHRERYWGSALWFRGNVLYMHDRVVARLERTLDGEWLVLLREHGCYGIPRPDLPKVEHMGYNNVTYMVPQFVPTLRLESVGVTTIYPGDKLTGAALHQHVRWQYTMKLEAILTEARTMGILRLVNGNGWYPKRLADEVVAAENDFDTYRKGLAPYLPDLPDFQQVIAVALNERLDRYHDPKAVEKRERELARKEARKALGLNEQKAKAA